MILFRLTLDPTAGELPFEKPTDGTTHTTAWNEMKIISIDN